jgi:hypothetical protein
MSFFVNEGQEGKTNSVQGLHQWEGGEHKERMKEGEYGGNTTYSCIKMEQ